MSATAFSKQNLLLEGYCVLVIRNQRFEVRQACAWVPIADHLGEKLLNPSEGWPDENYDLFNHEVILKGQMT